MSTAGAIGLVILGTLIGSWGALLFKMASGQFSFHPLRIITNWRLILGGSFYVISTVPFLIAVKHEDVSLLYPFVSTSYIWVVLLSLIFLKEKMNFWKWAGILLILLGVSFIGLGKSM